MRKLSLFALALAVLFAVIGADAYACRRGRYNRYQSRTVFRSRERVALVQAAPPVQLVQRINSPAQEVQAPQKVEVIPAPRAAVRLDVAPTSTQPLLLLQPVQALFAQVAPSQPLVVIHHSGGLFGRRTSTILTGSGSTVVNHTGGLLGRRSSSIMVIN